MVHHLDQVGPEMAAQAHFKLEAPVSKEMVDYFLSKVEGLIGFNHTYIHGLAPNRERLKVQFKKARRKWAQVQEDHSKD